MPDERGRQCVSRRKWKKRNILLLTFVVGVHSPPVYRRAEYLLGFRDRLIFSDSIGNGLWVGDAYLSKSNPHKPVSPADFGVTNFQTIEIPISEDMQSQRGYFLSQPDPTKVPTIVWFYGKNHSLGASLPHMAEAYKALGTNIVCVDYRGFGPVPGTPSETTMQEDARRIVDFVANKFRNADADSTDADNKSLPRIDKNRIFVMGHSLGSHPAMEVASHPSVRNLIKGVILANPVSTIPHVVRLTKAPLPQYYIETSFPQKFDNLSRAKVTSLPMLIMGATNDSETPMPVVNAVKSAASHVPQISIVLDGTGHLNPLGLAQHLPAQFTQVVSSFLNGQFVNEVGQESDTTSPLAMKPIKEHYHFNAPLWLQKETGVRMEFPQNTTKSWQDKTKDYIVSRVEEWNNYITRRTSTTQPKNDQPSD